jgi:hypothetical protein
MGSSSDGPAIAASKLAAARVNRTFPPTRAAGMTYGSCGVGNDPPSMSSTL